ncbi:hypothetical protein B0J13DRAFT_514709 [Dactylonectria estremocensis]|uniref:PD-(D/E)XK nuclease-like domain-containing protein n=1 Tax=Dactylonectria estremocensis TaxID=1079267 RepID=A0A9P9D9W7_9HYPO|nr:hypothetical protein B0J13DRAFT_514709 [Dactylonectria estremocensis]
MSTRCRVFDWLNTIPHDSDYTQQLSSCPAENTNPPSRKRRRFNPPTPESSKNRRKSRRMPSSHRDGSPSKRSFDSYDNDNENEQTPRAPRSNKHVHTPKSGSLSLASSQSEKSARSGQSSPSKHFNALERSARGVVSRELSQYHPQPPALEALLDEIDLIATGQGVLPVSDRETYSSLGNEEYWDLKWARKGASSDRYFSTERQSLGYTPSPDLVLDILFAAAECNGNSHPEATWNTEVHQRVLETALRQPTLRGPHLVNFVATTTAPIISEYHASVPPTKKVDFCVYIDPCNDDSNKSVSIIAALRDTLPCAVFNHTDHYPLRDRPIALSIETKKTGEGWENARLQLGVWQAAHWNFLRHLLGLAQRRSRVATGPGHDSVLQIDSLQLPDFLPGIIIQGHDWHLVITSPEGKKAVLWQKVTFGSTSSSKGIYQIISTLQLLRKWARDSYWPWLKQVLCELE